MSGIVHINTTGGTIASRIDPKSGGAVPAVSASELVAMSPAIGDYAKDVRVADFGMLQSWNIGPEVMRQIASVASTALRDEAVGGVVVTHGTDTMEETAFALDPSSSGRGTLLAMNDEIYAARYVTKTHTTAFSTFASLETGPLGIIDDRGVWYRSAVTASPHIICRRAETNVHLVKMAAGADALILNALVDAKVAGVVIEGSGAGNVPNVWNEPIAAFIAASTPVVLVSRSGPKARVALSLALGAGMQIDEVRALFAELSNHSS